MPASRHMVPTGLGLALIGAYTRVDKELCEPKIRAFMEQQVARIADGSESQEDVLRSNLDLFKGKFQHFSGKLDSLEPIFRPKDGFNAGWGDQDQDDWGGGGKGGKGKGGGKGK